MYVCYTILCEYVYCNMASHMRLAPQLWLCIRDWLWENPPVTHKDNYLEKRN